MMYAQYLRIERKAGGISCTNRDFITAAHTILSTEGKSSAMRKVRHCWLKAGMIYLINSRGLVL